MSHTSRFSNVHAILLGALIIAGSLLVATGTAPAIARTNGPYQLMQHSNTSASVGVFRLDTANGEVSYCFLNRNDTLACSAPVR